MEAHLHRSLFLSALLAGAMAGAAPALAADSDMPPEFRPSTFEIYIGAFGAASDVGGTYNGGFTDETIDRFSGNLDGVNYGFGIRGGVDYVINGWVLGAVADWVFADQAAEDHYNGATLDMPNLGTIRARAGYSVDDLMLYVTGGLAQAELEYSIDNEGADPVSGSDSGWTTGWALGAGFDFSLTESVSLGVEYLYVDLDDRNYEMGKGGDAVEFDHQLDGIHSIRLGIDYAFQI